MTEILLEVIGDEYEFLYVHHDSVAGFAEAMDAGERFIANGGKAFRELVEMRGDLFTSDREVAALGFALASVGII